MDKISIYECKDGRTRVYKKGTKTVTSYPRYLMERELGRPLDAKEDVHHKDLNPLNNDISNLEVRDKSEHLREHGQKYFDKEVECAWCGKRFLWTAKQQRKHYGNRNVVLKSYELHDKPFCSRSCCGSYGKKIQTLNAGVAE